VVPYASGPLAIDGRFDDAAWDGVPWTEPFVDIMGATGRTPTHLTAVRLLWDSTYFYVGARLVEPDLWATLTRRDAVIYRDNDFEVFIDPDGDSHAYAELEINALGTVWDLFLVRPYRDGGPALTGWDIHGLKSAVRLDGTLDDPSDRDEGWTVELALPWPALGEATDQAAPPNPGDQWRVNFSRVEWTLDVVDRSYRKRMDPATGKPLAEDNWVWSPQGIVNMHYPEMWGFVQFSSRPPRLVERFRPRTRDAARWALRRLYYNERAWYHDHGSYTADWGAVGFPGESIPGYAWPPVIRTTGNLLEALLAGPGGDTLRLTQDGRIR